MKFMKEGKNEKLAQENWLLIGVKIGIGMWIVLPICISLIVGIIWVVLLVLAKAIV